jgi:hypothetical protein
MYTTIQVLPVKIVSFNPYDVILYSKMNKLLILLVTQSINQ